MTDPWSVQSTNEDLRQENSVSESKETNTQNKIANYGNDSQTLGFEDSFIQDNNSNSIVAGSDKHTLKKSEHQPLPDSETYLQSLGNYAINLSKRVWD